MKNNTLTDTKGLLQVSIRKIAVTLTNPSCCVLWLPSPCRSRTSIDESASQKHSCRDIFGINYIKLKHVSDTSHRWRRPLRHSIPRWRQGDSNSSDVSIHVARRRSEPYS